MNQKDSIRIGPGASSLILIFVMLSLSVLAMLTLTGANNDRQMGRRSIQVTEEIYTLNEKAEATRAKVCEVLAECRAQGADDADYLQQAAGMLLASETYEDGLPAQMRLEEGAVCWEEGDGVYTLDCAVSLGLDGETAGDGAGALTGEWIRHNLTVDRAQMEDDWDEWS